jgi:ribosomal protein L4
MVKQSIHAIDVLRLLPWLQVVRWQRAKARQGTHKTKERHEVNTYNKLNYL